MYHHGWLMLKDDVGNVYELFNHARTAYYLQNGSLGCAKVHNVLDDGGCEAYAWVPDCTVTGVQAVDACNATDGWVRQAYSTPDVDEAPWANDSIPEAAEAYGFWITDWTGLDSGHVRRSVTPLGGAKGGGQLGPLGNGAREMGLEVVFLGASEEALDYLFRWLDATLSSVCRTCATSSILTRRTCPAIDESTCTFTGADLDKNVVEMRKVGLVSGLTWGTPPVENDGCYIRRANFTLAAGDPCMYSVGEEISLTQMLDWGECLTQMDPPVAAPCSPPCISLDNSCRAVFDFDIVSAGASAPVVTMVAPPGVDSAPFRVRLYANNVGATGSDICALPLLAELRMGSVPSSSTVVWDVAGRTTTITIAAGTLSASSWFTPNEVGVPRYAALGCGSYTVVIEPDDLCIDYTDVSGDVVDDLNGRVHEIEPFGDKNYIGGAFTTGAGDTLNRVALTRNGVLDTTFNIGGTIGVSGTVYALAVQPDGKLLVGGNFATARGTTQNNIARLNVDGTLDTSFNTGGTVGVNGIVYAIALQPDGKIVVGGAFTTARGTARNRIARLDTDGTLDAGFTPGTGANDVVRALALQSDGFVLAGGDFTTMAGTTVNRIARLEADGSLDATFNTGGTVGVNSDVYEIKLDDDRILIGGIFTTARGTTARRIARLEADGSLDASFDTSDGPSTSSVEGIVLVSGGKVVIAGQFTAIEGVTVNGLARLNTDGSLDTTFNTGGTVGHNELVHDVVALGDGRLIVAGGFTTIRGAAIQYLARLLPDGTVDPSFYPDSVADDYSAPPFATAEQVERMGCA